MTVTRFPGGDPALTEAAQSLSKIARELGELSHTLATQASSDSPEAERLGASQEELAALAQRLDDWHTQEAAFQAQVVDDARLRKRVLNALLKGPALPIELAAATLSLPEEIRPVLDRLEDEGLIATRGGRLLTLTGAGRRVARRSRR